MGFLGSVVKWFVATLVAYAAFQLALTLLSEGLDVGAWFGRLATGGGIAFLFGTVFAVSFYLATLVRAATGWPGAVLQPVLGVVAFLILSTASITAGGLTALVLSTPLIVYGVYGGVGLLGGLIYGNA